MTAAEWHNHEEYIADIDLIGMMTTEHEEEENEERTTEHEEEENEE